MNLMRKASNGWILTCLIACVLLFTLTGIAWSSGAFAFTTAVFWSFTVALLPFLCHVFEASRAPIHWLARFYKGVQHGVAGGGHRILLGVL